MTTASKSKLLHLGATQSGKRIFIDPVVRKTHMHVLGASGRGKSFFLEHLIRQDIKNGDGLCLIDPHGTLYHKIVAWCAQYPAFSWDKVVLLDASAPGWTFGFNPLNFAGADTSFAVDSMVNACAQVWGGEDTSSTPLLKGVLRGVFHALAENGLTLIEAEYLIDERDEWKPLRKSITRDIIDPVIRGEWDKWNELKPREFREHFSSTTNRLMEFLSAQVIRSIVGQQEYVIDFRKIMDAGGIVLVNLESRGRLSEFNARTLGTLLTNDLFLKAQGRPEGSRPFYLYIDECGRYLNESIQRILDESRKRGLHLILANQHLSQLRAAGETVYGAVMTDAQTKVVFGGLASEDADTMVKEVFLDLDLEEPKHSLARKVAVGQEAIILRSGSEGHSTSTGTSRAESEAHGWSRGTTSGASESESEVIFPDDIEGPTTSAWGVSQGTSDTESHSTSSSVTESAAESVSEMNGWTESFKTIYAEVVGGVHTLEEQRYKKMAWLKKQPQQMALLVLPDFSLIPFRVADVGQPITTPEMREHLVEKRFNALPFVQRDDESVIHFEQRTVALKQKAGLLPANMEPGDFDPFDNN